MEVSGYFDLEGILSVKTKLKNNQVMECMQQSAAKKQFKKQVYHPWYVQKKLQHSISQISLNHTLSAAQSARKIETLLHNNKCLAKALENCKYELAKKENVENFDVVSMAGLKIKDLSDNLKKITGCMDELVALLQSRKQTKDSENYLYATASRHDFKRKLKSLARMEKLQEVVESYPTDSKHIQHFNNCKESKKSLAKNIKGKTTPQASFKQKSTKRCLKQVISKLPKTVSQRDNRALDDSLPSYLLNLSSHIDSFKNKIEEDKDEAGYKGPRKKKPFKSKRETLMQHSTNVLGKSKQETASCKRSRPIQSSINKKNTKDSDKAAKFTSHKKAKLTFTLQDDTIISQSSSDGASTSSGGNSCENVCSITSFSTETKKDDVASGLQYDTEIFNLNEDFNTVQPIESYIATHNMHTDGIYTSLEAEILLRQPRVVLRKSDVPLTFIKQDSVPLNENLDGGQAYSKKCDPSETDTSIPKKKVKFLLEEDDIEILSATSEPLKKVIVAKTKKRPLKENFEHLASVPKKQALFTSREALQSNDIMSKNTFVVTAEIHKPPDDFIPEKTPSLKKITQSGQLNMQPRVVLTDIYKCNSQNVVWGSNYQSRIVQKDFQIVQKEFQIVQKESQIVQKESQIVHEEQATTEMVEKDQNSLHFEDTSSENDLLAMSNKENKIDGQNFSGERKQSRRVSSKVSSYKEMKLNAKLRRC